MLDSVRRAGLADKGERVDKRDNVWQSKRKILKKRRKRKEPLFSLPLIKWMIKWKRRMMKRKGEVWFEDEEAHLTGYALVFKE